MEKEMIQMIYGIEMREEGIESALKKNLREVDEKTKEISKELKKIHKKDAPIAMVTQNADAKLEFIKWALMFKDKKKVKEALPFLIKEIRNVADELEEFINE